LSPKQQEGRSVLACFLVCVAAARMARYRTIQLLENRISRTIAKADSYESAFFVQNCNNNLSLDFDSGIGPQFSTFNSGNLC